MTTEELKAGLMAEAEKAIEKVLAEKTSPDKITLTEIERLAVRSGEEFKAEVLKALAGESGQQQGEQEQMCPQCGQRMQRRGWRQRTIVTEAGSSAFERAYYLCPGCGRACFPPG
jgi:uncharacterized protein with PIN domain